SAVVQNLKEQDNSDSICVNSNDCMSSDKALGRERIEFLINKLGMRSFTPDTLKQIGR
ncbi:hypothetical protein Tco_0577403, partial [Tanacetum coccineum]